MSCGQDALLRPTLATLRHAADEKFLGHDGIKKLCEDYLGMRYLEKPEIALEILKNKTKNDLKNPNIYEDNENKFGKRVHDSYLVDCYVKFIDDELGYGLFANRFIKSGELIGEYTGIISDSAKVKDHSWSWAYPKDIYKIASDLPSISLDAHYDGNALRFANHSDNPNTTMERIFLDGMARTLYVANKDIDKDQQILVSYGQNYWKNRKKKEL